MRNVSLVNTIIKFLKHPSFTIKAVLEKLILFFLTMFSRHQSDAKSWVTVPTPLSMIRDNVFEVWNSVEQKTTGIRIKKRKVGIFFSIFELERINSLPFFLRPSNLMLMAHIGVLGVWPNVSADGLGSWLQNLGV